jgi:dephospho-CoA kinase
MKKKWKVGITGGIGSGKTTVCRIFETLGIPVYYADERAKWLMINNKTLKKEIISLFGAAAYSAVGELNRKHIADIAFQDPDKLKQLNQIVHPAVLSDGEKWHRKQVNVPYTLKEAALLFESGSYLQLDKIITVTAPLEIRIQRVIERDQSDREKVMSRIKFQMPEEEKIAQSQFIIINDGQHSLIRQVLDIHRKLI